MSLLEQPEIQGRARQPFGYAGCNDFAVWQRRQRRQAPCLHHLRGSQRYAIHGVNRLLPVGVASTDFLQLPINDRSLGARWPLPIGIVQMASATEKVSVWLILAARVVNLLIALVKLFQLLS